ncbi:Hpt domain-containing protein [Oceaniovalibus sp. ACAM 378]|uniref:Hpt domain-containing protein n=1 Tax=Oceaniovalibus sp. ACAM 378 TaxID=2599923 RepID=UPI00351ADAA3
MMIAWGRITQLRSEIGEDDFSEVVALFLEEVDGVIDRLRITSDPATMAADLHFLKGSALNLGFAAFADLCEQGEALAETGRADQVPVADVIRCYDASRTEFLAGL